ncbi:branched-chain alpha-keto acid dehydrogenase E1 alpha chain [Sulfobacillus acidophilus TPY]|uniref:2-oxoisovalerate dehydrogenase subunit alpha n=1 Tax=Sulfobacillus acidophilus (strain ATCC 700253 / DSM 10332 / NAL) TaxID=679936 RepID=G8TUF8_SULAD|nr:branched-chain alpha-keto acid dehydrogenase E1 alpha chain [Sulfobacillus acidophilus TPY]AEW06920.1 3-methyl-2-oxobutanoate dehydrogenase (2-methylpropanoyl-transferring) [Sulfobacillus acidophilus DSM 10332]MCY0864428.1 thiamine pyrophosphate-dependent dehydrogenase E1 component subunit alpha [Sulfobacillus sp.]
MPHDAGATNWDLPLDQIHTLYYYMVLSRALDQRIWILNRQGKSAFVISGQGQEGVQAGAALALDPQVDWLAPYYRDLTLVMAFGMTPEEIMLAQLAKRDDPSSGGRQMPAHFGHPAKHILTGSSPVATQVPHAVGMAWAMKLQHHPGVVLTSLGEGSTNQGEFHEALNFAAVVKAPVIILVENNGYAISVPQRREMAIQDVALRAKAYGIPGVVVRGSDPLAVYQVVKEARQRALAGEGPTLIEAKTHRFTAHSSDDDDRTYRPRELLNEEKKDDPIHLFRTWMAEQALWDDEREADLMRRVADIVNQATTAAENAPFPSPDTLTQNVYGPSPV